MLKVGNKVKVKSFEDILKYGYRVRKVEGRIAFNDTDGLIFNEGMVGYCGMETTITEVDKKSFPFPVYVLADDKEGWNWTEFMLEKIK